MHIPMIDLEREAYFKMTVLHGLLGGKLAGEIRDFPLGEFRLRLNGTRQMYVLVDAYPSHIPAPELQPGQAAVFYHDDYVGYIAANGGMLFARDGHATGSTGVELIDALNVFISSAWEKRWLERYRSSQP